MKISKMLLVLAFVIMLGSVYEHPAQAASGGTLVCNPYCTYMNVASPPSGHYWIDITMNVMNINYQYPTQWQEADMPLTGGSFIGEVYGFNPQFITFSTGGIWDTSVYPANAGDNQYHQWKMHWMPLQNNWYGSIDDGADTKTWSDMSGGGTFFRYGAETATTDPNKLITRMINIKATDDTGTVYDLPAIYYP